jgi:hypothetical protein
VGAELEFDFGLSFQGNRVEPEIALELGLGLF